MNPITEAEVWKALPQDESSFLLQYCAYAERVSDAPMAYHLGAGLALLAALAPPDLFIDQLPGGRINANIWVLITGRPAVDHKTTAIGVADSLLCQVAPRRRGNTPDSLEGLIESMAAEPTQLMVMGEFGDLLGRADGGGHSVKIKPGLLALYDSLPIERKLSRKVVKIPNPRLSLLAGVNPALIERHGTLTDWEGGLMSRFMTMLAYRERDLYRRDGVSDNEHRDWLVSWMEAESQLHVGPCVGLTDTAWDMWVAWCQDMDRRAMKAVDLGQIAAHGRTHTQAAKVALLLGYDYGPARDGKPWSINEEVLGRAISIAELHYRSATTLAAMVFPSVDMRHRWAVLRAIGKDWTPYGQVLRDSNLLRGRADMIMETLLEEGAVESQVINGRGHYRQSQAGQAELVWRDLAAEELLQAARGYGEAEA